MIKIKLDKLDKKPYYLQIQERIREAIYQGELSPNTRLPTLREWSSIIGVNLHTLNKALNNLTKAGFLYRRRNLGTFVNKEPGKESITKKKTSQSKVLVLLSGKEKLDYSYIREVIKGIQSKCLSYDLKIEVKSFDREEDFLSWKKLSKKKDIKGLIIDKEGFFNKDVMRIIEEYSGEKVLFNSHLPAHRQIPSIEMDNEKGAFLATNYLIEKGHEKIAVILRSNIVLQLKLAYKTDVLKLEGYKLALQRHDLEVKDEYQKGEVYNNPQKIRKAVDELLSLASVPTAVLSADDLIAFEVLKILNEKGLKVPEDISLIGFNNFIHSSITQPKLTTIETPMLQMGQKAVDLLFGNFENKHLILDVTLIERNSVCLVS